MAVCICTFELNIFFLFLRVKRGLKGNRSSFSMLVLAVCDATIQYIILYYQILLLVTSSLFLYRQQQA